MTADVLAATLIAPGQLELRHYPYPEHLEPGAVLLRMLASGICGTDKHTYRGETQQYAGTDHASSTPFPIVQGHENLGEVVAIGDGGATAFDGSPLAVGDRVVPAPNRACGSCEYCLGDFPYYFCRRLENYGNSLTCADAPHLFGGWAEYLYIRPGTPMFHVPDGLPDEVAVLTEIFAVTHSLDLVRAMPRPGGFQEGDTVAIMGAGPVGIAHAAKARIMGASMVIAIDPYRPRVELTGEMGATDLIVASAGDPSLAAQVRDLTNGRGVDVVVDATGHPVEFRAVARRAARRRDADRGRCLRRPRHRPDQPGDHPRPQPHDRRRGRRGRARLRPHPRDVRRAPPTSAVPQGGDPPVPAARRRTGDADRARRRHRHEGRHHAEPVSRTLSIPSSPRGMMDRWNVRSAELT